MLEIISRIKKRGDILYMGVYLIVISNSRYYIYATKLF